MQIDASSYKSYIPGVIRTIIYYDVFNYPVTLDNFIINCNKIKEESYLCKQALDHLVKIGAVYKIDNYYSLRPDKKNIDRRIMGNKRAVEWMKKARRFSSIISFFPYVRGISLSGSLSKGYIGDDPDIDYFIITKPKRLWLTRTLLVAFKKIFLINSHRYFCINYFIDAENMEIEEKNIFTATEIATLKPIYGGKTKINFYKQNSWVGKYYPNYINHEELENLNGRIKPLTRATEFILNNKFGDWLDGYFMRFTIKHWSKKYSSNFSDEEFDLVFKSEKYVSKHHPRNFQNKVLHEFRERAQRVCEKHNLPIEEVII